MWAYIFTPLGFKDQLGFCSTFVGFLIRFCLVINQQRCPACLIQNATCRTNQTRKKIRLSDKRVCFLSWAVWSHMERGTTADVSLHTQAPPIPPPLLTAEFLVFTNGWWCSRPPGASDFLCWRRHTWWNAAEVDLCLDKREVLSKCLIPWREAATAAALVSYRNSIPLGSHGNHSYKKTCPEQLDEGGWTGERLGHFTDETLFYLPPHLEPWLRNKLVVVNER